MDNDAIKHGKDYLEHHGVKGMRWGVRRTKEQRRKDRESAREQKSENKTALKAHKSATKQAAKIQKITDDAAAKSRARVDKQLSKLNKKAVKREDRETRKRNDKLAKQKAKAASEQSHQDKIRADKLRGKKPNQMSNEEMRILTDRLALEKRYKELNPGIGTRAIGRANSTYNVAKLASNSYKLLASEEGQRAVSFGMAKTANSPGMQKMLKSLVVKKLTPTKSARS